jgi:hypothetical protein
MVPSLESCQPARRIDHIGEVIMASWPSYRTRLTLLLAVVILVACSAMGAVAGTVTHALTAEQAANAGPSGPVVSGTPPAQAVATATATLVPTVTTTSSITARFTLALSVAPRALTANRPFTVTVIATANGAPVSGLSVTLRAPTSGPPGLFADWPAPAVTDDTGTATWSLTTPAVAAGTYGIEAEAVGSGHYEFHRYTSVTVS